ncbi:hypothetical protein GEMRC1_006968 [Eukaryota sp. GEM-RC1]
MQSESFNQTVSRLTREINFLHSAASETSASFRRTISERDEQLKQLQTAKTNLELKCLHLQEKLGQLEQDYDRLRLRLETPTENLYGRPKPSLSSKKEESLKKLVAESETAALASAAEAERAVTELKKITNENLLLHDKIEKLQKDSKSISKKLHNADVIQSENETLKRIVDELKVQGSSEQVVKKLEDEIQELKTYIRGQRMPTERYEKLEKENIDLKEIVQDLRQNEVSVVRLMKLERENSELMKYIEELRQNEVSLTNYLKIEKENSELKQTVEDLKKNEKSMTTCLKVENENLELKSELQELRHTLSSFDQLKTDKSSLQHENTFLKEELQSLQDRQETLIKAAVTSIDKEKDDVLQQLDKKTEEFYDLQKENTKLSQECDSLTLTIEQLQLEVQAYQRQSDELHSLSQSKEIERNKAVQNAEKFQKEVEFIKRELTHNRQEQSNLKEEINKLVEECDQLADIRDAVTSDLQQSLRLLDAANREIVELEDEKVQMSSAITISAQKAAAAERGKNEIEQKLSRKILQLTDDLEAIRSGYYELEGELSRVQNQI